MSENVIGRKMRMAMEYRGISHTVLARTIGQVGVLELLEYTGGEETPDSTTLIAIADALGVSVDWLMTSLEDTDRLMQDGLKERE